MHVFVCTVPPAEVLVYYGGGSYLISNFINVAPGAWAGEAKKRTSQRSVCRWVAPASSAFIDYPIDAFPNYKLVIRF